MLCVRLLIMILFASPAFFLPHHHHQCALRRVSLVVCPLWPSSNYPNCIWRMRSKIINECGDDEMIIFCARFDFFFLPQCFLCFRWRTHLLWRFFYHRKKNLIAWNVILESCVLSSNYSWVQLSVGTSRTQFVRNQFEFARKVEDMWFSFHFNA